MLTSAGGVEMSAMLMEGSHLGAGSVAAVTDILNPVALARRVMEDTPHVMLAGSALRGGVYIAVSVFADFVQ